MAKNPKTNRTQIKDIPAKEQDLTQGEAGKVKGGRNPDYDVKVPAPPAQKCSCGYSKGHSGPCAQGPLGDGPKY